MKASEKVIDFTLYDGELVDIVEISCPVCQGDILEPLPVKGYECQRCGQVFND